MRDNSFEKNKITKQCSQKKKLVYITPEAHQKSILMHNYVSVHVLIINQQCFRCGCDLGKKNLDDVRHTHADNIATVFFGGGLIVLTEPDLGVLGLVSLSVSLSVI